MILSDEIDIFYLQGYSWEITTIEGGYGLHELLSSRNSVLNGMSVLLVLKCTFVSWRKGHMIRSISFC